MTSRGEDQQAAREARLDELHDKLTAAVDQLVSGEDWKRALAFAANFRSRSFNNTLLIWAQHAAAFERGLVPEPTPSYVAGYKQWQGLGRQVQKGQPGYQIIAPVTGRFASANPQDAESWRRLGKFEKPRPGETVRSKMVGVRPAYVWDASQTAGDDIPSPIRPHRLVGGARRAGEGRRVHSGRGRVGLGDSWGEWGHRLPRPHRDRPGGHGCRGPGQDAGPRVGARPHARPGQSGGSPAPWHRRGRS